MTFASILKGRIAERVVVTLLERGGFRITRLGIEELFDEIKYLPREQYLALGLPAQLRALPDILVADPQITWARLLEIKFRKRFDAETARELYSTLCDQRQFWPDAWALVMIAEPFVDGGKFHRDYIRLLGPDDLNKLTARFIIPDEREHMRVVWNNLPMLTKLFYNPHSDDDAGRQLAQNFWAGADFITAAIRELRNL